MSDLGKIYVLSVFTYILKNDDTVIVCHTGNGAHIKMPMECWNVIEEYLPCYTPEQVCLAAHAEDKIYYRNIYENLIRVNILVSPHSEHLDEVYLIITNRCNLKCTHCCESAVGINEKDILSIHEWKNILEKIFAEKVSKIVITGGEPMVREDFFDIVNYIKERFSGILALSTNGLLISKNNVKKITQTFDSISISLDGYDEITCSFHRGKGIFSKVIDNINLIKSSGFPAQNIYVSMVETAITHNGKDKFYQLCNELGVIPMVREFSATGRGRDNEDWLMPNTLKENGNCMETHELSKIKSSILFCQNCTAGRTKICINQAGDVFPCPALENKKYYLGNALEVDNLKSFLLQNELHSISNIRECQGKKNFKKLLIKNRDKCKDCNVSAFCIMCIEEFERKVENVGYEQMCNKNKEILSEVLWK